CCNIELRVISMKIKPLEEIVENYVIGTIQGAYKMKRYWKERGWDEEHAIDYATRYAIGQLKSGVGESCDVEKAIAIFREISAIATALADFLERV
nr:hypothetical protein [Candidatus Sigynarchaeota archaeon]